MFNPEPIVFILCYIVSHERGASARKRLARRLLNMIDVNMNVYANILYSEYWLERVMYYNILAAGIG